MEKNKDLLDNIAVERKTSELLQILEYENDLSIFRNHLSILNKVIPNIDTLTDTIILNVLRVKSIYEKLAFIYSQFGIDNLYTLKLDNKTIKIVQSLYELINVKNVKDYELKALLATYNEQILYMWNNMLELNYSDRINEIIALKIPYRIKDLDIKGEDLLALNIEPIKIGKILESLILKVRKNPELNKKDKLLQLCG